MGLVALALTGLVSSRLLTLAASCGYTPVPSWTEPQAFLLPHTLIPFTHFGHLGAESPAGPQSLLDISPKGPFWSLSHTLSQ